MTAAQCSECARPLGGNTALCRHCVDELVDHLFKVPAYLLQITITRAGLGRTGMPTGGGSMSEPPLPIRIVGNSSKLPGESAVRRLETAVIGWARVIAEELDVTPAVNISYLVQLTQDRRVLPGTSRDVDAAALGAPVTATEQAAVWLAHHRREIARHAAAPELAREINTAVKSLSHVIWPVPREYVGLCAALDSDGEKCGCELWAESGTTYTWCRRCKTRHIVSDLKATALHDAADRTYKINDLVRVLREFGHRVSRTTLFRWASEDRLESCGYQHRTSDGIRITEHRIQRGDPQVYRLGDALRLARVDDTEGGSAA